MIGNIRLDIFQGPLDLLLTLIERQEIDIQAIPVAEVTAQYLEYLHEVEELDLDWASEFLVLGAELLALKARLLLQRPLKGGPGEEEKGEGEDPARLLAERLIEYRRYREVAAHLGDLAAQGALIFGRPLDQEAVTRALAGINPLAGVTPLDLARALARVLARQPVTHKPQTRIITRPALTLVGQIRTILRRLHQQEELTLASLLSPRPTRLEVALTFLALLELARRGRVILTQEEAFGNIKVRRFFPSETAVARE
ncbi:Prokaryotic chromosome segregation/condensation protein ScpA [Moorella glycerini]|uniref:Segregation and condensation protein A n=1 Tax=Neomoorella stamsii TaxID=1266720 RepID=A0A9X7J423_9FIRM|nr:MULTISPECIES: segregation/condensation protein A [Moorella]PRR72711.1 Segregation and condensation protein A [Moorella stamsii]CEP68056.1 Prokaryotic chromosome segregation/condensation protein ScpA [Moorella glycerini]